MSRDLSVGPKSGSYFMFTMGPIEITVADATFLYRLIMPMEGKISSLSMVTDVTTSAPTWALSVGGNDLRAAGLFGASDATQTIAAASVTNRVFAKGDVLLLTVIGDASDDVITRGMLTVCGYFTGHDAADSDDD